MHRFPRSRGTGTTTTGAEETTIQYRDPTFATYETAGKTPIPMRVLPDHDVRDEALHEARAGKTPDLDYATDDKLDSEKHLIVHEDTSASSIPGRTSPTTGAVHSSRPSQISSPRLLCLDKGFPESSL